MSETLTQYRFRIRMQIALEAKAQVLRIRAELGLNKFGR